MMSLKRCTNKTNRGNVINYFALCSCVVDVLFCFFVDFYMLINHLLEKKSASKTIHNSLLIQFEITLHLHIIMTSGFIKKDDNNRY